MRYVFVLVCFALVAVSFSPPVYAQRGDKRQRFRRPPVEITVTTVPTPTLHPTIRPIATIQTIVWISPSPSITQTPIHTLEPRPTVEIVILDGVPKMPYRFIRFVWPKFTWWSLTPLTNLLGNIFGWG